MGELRHGAGDADPLALPARERQTALADLRVVAVRHLRDEVVRVGHLRGLDDLPRVSPRAGHRRCCRGWCRETGRCPAKRNRSARAAGRACKSRTSTPSIEHPAGGRIVEARDEAQHGGFAAAGRAADADALAGLDGEIDVAQHRRCRVVGEGHMLEDNLALELARIARVGLLRNDRHRRREWSGCVPTPTAAWAMTLVILARSCTGLKNLLR